MERRKWGKWGCRQSQGLAGLSFTSAMGILAAVELPLPWAIPLGSGQAAGLLVAIVSVLFCFYAAHNKQASRSGSGVLCEKCELPVFLGTYHCEICEICVPGYSHHSHWLNTCIGQSNTRAYFSGLAGLALATACQATAGIGLLVLKMLDSDVALRVKQRYSLHDHCYSFNLLLISAVLVAVFVSFASICILSFHLFKVYFRWKTQRQRQILPNSVLISPKSAAPICSVSKFRNESFDSCAGDSAAIKENDSTVWPQLP